MRPECAGMGPAVMNAGGVAVGMGSANNGGAHDIGRCLSRSGRERRAARSVGGVRRRCQGTRSGRRSRRWNAPIGTKVVAVMISVPREGGPVRRDPKGGGCGGKNGGLPTGAHGRFVGTQKAGSLPPRRWSIPAYGLCRRRRWSAFGRRTTALSGRLEAGKECMRETGRGFAHRIHAMDGDIRAAIEHCHTAHRKLACRCMRGSYILPSKFMYHLSDTSPNLERRITLRKKCHLENCDAWAAAGSPSSSCLDPKQDEVPAVWKMLNRSRLGVCLNAQAVHATHAINSVIGTADDTPHVALKHMLAKTRHFYDEL